MTAFVIRHHESGMWWEGVCYAICQMHEIAVGTAFWSLGD